MQDLARIIASRLEDEDSIRVRFPTALQWCSSYNFVEMWRNNSPLESMDPPEDLDKRYDLTIIFPRVMNLLTSLSRQTKWTTAALFIDRHVLKCNKGKA